MDALKDFLQDQRSFNGFMHDEEGVTAIEYGLLAALIAIVIIAAVRQVGVNLDLIFDAVAAALGSALGGGGGGGGAGAGG